MKQEPEVTPLDAGCVLIVGAMARNFADPQYREHPRIIWWDSNDPTIKKRTKQIPSNVKAVIMIPKFIGHAANDNILAQTRDRRIPLYMVNGTGDIKRRLDVMLSKPMRRVTDIKDIPWQDAYTVVEPPAVTETPKTEAAVLPTTPTSVPASVPAKTKRIAAGVLKAFVDTHMTLKGTNADEARRLLPLAIAEGIATTFKSLETSVAHARRLLRKQGGTPQVVAAPATPESKDEVSAIIDDAIAGLELLRELHAGVRNENAMLRAKLEAFKKLTEGLE